MKFDEIHFPLAKQRSYKKLDDCPDVEMGPSSWQNVAILTESPDIGNDTAPKTRDNRSNV